MTTMSDASLEANASSGDRPPGRVRRLGVHPVKSLRGRHVAAWRFDARGPLLDRRWMLIDESRRFVSLREVPRLARCVVAWDDDEVLATATVPDRISFDWDGDRLDVAPSSPDSSNADTATLWGSERVVLDEGDAAADWFTKRLERPVRLVRHLPERDPWCQEDPPARRARTGLSDGYPVLVVAASTIQASVGSEWSPDRFRANILVEGVPPHAEDGWGRIAVGEVVLELVKPCVRCVATTVEPTTGERSGREPLATLARTRTWRSGPVLGWNALVIQEGAIATGDEVRVLQGRPDDDIDPVQVVDLESG